MIAETILTPIDVLATKEASPWRKGFLTVIMPSSFSPKSTEDQWIEKYVTSQFLLYLFNEYIQEKNYTLFFWFLPIQIHKSQNKWREFRGF